MRLPVLAAPIIAAPAPVPPAPGGAPSATLPRDPRVHLFEADSGTHLLVTDGSRVYTLDVATADDFAAAIAAADGPRVGDLLERHGLVASAPTVGDDPIDPPAVRALSLAVAQKCNLGCTYCYAQGGNFGAAPTDMPVPVALGAVELLLAGAGPGDRFNLSFLGGEPLSNRGTLRAATEHAARLARAAGARVGFSLTTNGTLLTEGDAAFLEHHGFAVTISIDGVGERHDRLRPTKSGRGTYDAILRRARPLLAAQRRMQVSARATVTPDNLRLRETLDELVSLGFHSVGFSPMLASPTGRGQMDAGGLSDMLAAMIECGEAFRRHLLAGGRYPFLNMVNALREIHQGTHRPYPCGAGAGYLGVSADGKLSACHRFVGDSAGAMGDLDAGPDEAARGRWLADRHVHRQEPCRSCWARYLCGGGCHHEVLRRGRHACDYIRGWLDYCLTAYVSLLAGRPDYFAPAVTTARR